MCPQYDVTMHVGQLNDAIRIAKKGRKSLTRILVTKLVGEENLPNLSGSLIPKDVFNAIECKNFLFATFKNLQKKPYMVIIKQIFKLLVMQRSFFSEVFY